MVPVNTKQCSQCERTFEKRMNESIESWRSHKYCSRKCGNDSRKGKPFFDSTGLPAWNKGKKGYMSKEGRLKIGESTRNTLKNLSKEQVADRISKMVKYRKEHNLFKGTLGRTGELSAPWKGDKANYNSKHKWIQKHWTKTGTCQECGTETKPFGNRRWGTEWHNKNRDYDRESKEGWVELCKKCHRKADRGY